MGKLDSGEKKDAGFSASGEVEAQERECYLDCLPDNVLENIIRLMSASPRAPAWAERLANSDVCTLFSLGGEMERVARECFRSLSFEAMYREPHPGFESKKPHAHRLIISSTNMSTAKLMNLASPSYTALGVRDPLSNLLGQPAHLDEFLRKCPNVKRLDIYSESTCAWLEKLGPRLERLAMPISSPPIWQSISSFCTQLHELHIGEAYNFAVCRSDLWEKVGGTLEKLSVTFVFYASTEIRKIQQHCRKIRWLHIPEEECANPALAECIVSYGEQLEYAFLAGMNQSQLEAIVAACPNAKFQMSMEESCHGNSLQLVGSRLEKVVLFKYGMNDFRSLANGWNACPNIEKVLLLKEVSLSYIRAMFTKPKPALLELELLIGVAEEISTVREIVDCIAEKTGSLRRFDLTMEALADGLFDKLVARNQSLQEFVCTALECEEDRKCDLAKMAEGILKSPKLKRCWIYVDNHEGVRDKAHKKLKEVVRPHQHRLLVVVINDHSYLI